MAVTIESENSTIQLLQNIGIESKLISDFNMSTGKVVLGATSIKLYIEYNLGTCGQFKSVVVIGAKAIGLLIKGELGDSAKVLIIDKVEYAMKLCITQLHVQYDIIPESVVLQETKDSKMPLFKGGGVEKYKLGSMVPEKVVQEEFKGGSNDTLDMMVIKNIKMMMCVPHKHRKNKKTVMLKDAQELLDPVRATSEGSIYHVVAWSSELKLAARWKNENISFRVEGNIKKYKKSLMDVGMSGGSSHVSMHVKVDSLTLANKVLGSLMFGLGNIFSDVISSMIIIKDKGA